jgi:geranylgeranyl diphosphate synthase type I
MSKDKEFAKKQLKKFQPMVEEDIKECFVLLREYFRKNDRYFPNGLNQFTDMSLSILEECTLRDAKRLRASFVYYVSQMIKSETVVDSKVSLRIASVIEIIHAYLLIEDDIMDLSLKRRGKPTVHKTLEKFHTDNNLKNDAKHFGVSSSINIGLIASHLAAYLITELKIDHEIKNNILKNINENLIITSIGQLNDVYNEVKLDIIEEEVIDVLKCKTAAYTYENPIHTGAILAGATEEELEILAKFSVPGGIAFQIQDDILGMFGNTDKTGKSNMDDLKEGKATLLIVKALEKTDREGETLIKQALGNNEITKEAHSKVQQIIVDTGSLEYSRKLAKEHTLKALKTLQNPPQNWNKKGVRYLRGITEYVISRSK